MSAAEFVPQGAGIDELREAARGCRGCELYQAATQTVFGRGPAHASVVMVGEQPGDVEDRRGVPFVGPAGRVLVQAIEEAGLDKSDIYVTNAVKHFKYERSGSGGRRIHRTPDRVEIVACRPWLVAEFAATSPKVVVALGAPAAKGLLGPGFRVTRQRGQVLPWPDSADRPADFTQEKSAVLVATIHPSAVLRADDRQRAYDGLVADLRVVRRQLDVA